MSGWVGRQPSHVWVAPLCMCSVCRLVGWFIRGQAKEERTKSARVCARMPIRLIHDRLTHGKLPLVDVPRLDRWHRRLPIQRTVEVGCLDGHGGAANAVRRGGEGWGVCASWNVCVWMVDMTARGGITNRPGHAFSSVYTSMCLHTLTVSHNLPNTHSLSHTHTYAHTSPCIAPCSRDVPRRALPRVGHVRLAGEHLVVFRGKGSEMAVGGVGWDGRGVGARDNQSVGQLAKPSPPLQPNAPSRIGPWAGTFPRPAQDTAGGASSAARCWAAP